jgi:predicted flap endonuclease-1-like 5' DNA nuclease
MGRKARLKKERKQQPQRNVVIDDLHTGQEHSFSPQQMRVVAEMVARARKEGQEKAALEFVKWFDTITELKGIGPQRARELANHFLAFKPGGPQ